MLLGFLYRYNIGGNITAMAQSKSIRVNGYMRAVADSDHPLQTKLSLILTDFHPNGNKQGIPITEKLNILTSAKYQPLKINFDGDGINGHIGAMPIGPIISVYESTDNDRDVIAGDAIIWNEVYDDIADHLKVAFSEGIGTSWEIFYESSEIDESGVEWLHGCTFAGTCVVKVPAYGPNRTRILAIAEQLHKQEPRLLELQQEMAKQANAASDTMDVTREELLEAQDLLFKLWEGVDGLFSKTFEIEEKQVTNDLGTIAEQFAEKISKLSTKITDLVQSLAEKETLLTTAKAELDVLKKDAEEKAAAALLADRKSRLTTAGLDEETFTARQAIYMAMETDVFDTVVTDMLLVKGKKAESTQQKPLIPEPTGSVQTSPSLEDIAVELNKQRNK